MKKKKEVLDMVKNGRDFKLVIVRAEDNFIESVMEKPSIDFVDFDSKEGKKLLDEFQESQE